MICAGVYYEQSVPASGNNSPSQTGSRNGLTITKPLTIKGAGADKVTIRPAAALGASLAGTAPYLRDGGGNVVTVSRQSGGSSDDNENFLDLSGVTIESPDTYAEAGLAFFNTSGRLANSRIGTIKSEGGPYTYGLLMTNSLQGAEAGIRREVTIEKSIVNGAVLFDDARGADGTATTTVRSGIKAYGNVAGSRVAGSVGYTYGQRGSITGSEITGAVVLTDAETGPDPSNPLVRAFSATGSSLLGGLTNTGTTAALVAGNFWGTSTTTGPVETGTVLSRGARAAERAGRDARRAPDRRDRRSVRPDDRGLGRDDLPGRRRRRRLRRQVRRAHRERPAGRDRRAHAVRVRVPPRVRAHR